MITILAFDPSITCTGWARVRHDGQNASLLNSGVIVPEGTKSSERLRDLYRRIQSVFSECDPANLDAVAVEFWQTTSFGKGRERNSNTLPLYGAAVGVAFVAALYMANAHSLPIHEVSVTDWGLKIPAGDEHKTKRVEAVRYYLGTDLRAKFTRQEAGNVADAALMAWWLAPRLEFEKARAA